MRGRKPTPTHLKVLRGNPGHRPLNHDEATVRPGAAIPTWLRGGGRAYWEPMARELEEAGLLSNIDATVLAMLCDSIARFESASSFLEKFGDVVKSPNGFPVQSPYLSIANKAKEQIVKITTEFGMTPSSRSHVKAIKQEKKNAFAELLKWRKKRV